MSTYNVYGNRQAKIGEHKPIWLGTVCPIPVGGKLASAEVKAGAYLPAGTAMELKSGVATPFRGFVVKAYTTSSTNSIITVKPIFAGDAPKTTDFLMKVGSTFAGTAKAWNPDSVAANSDDDSLYDITVATSGIDVVAEGDVLGYSSAVAEGSSKSLKVQPTHYLYNDVRIDELGDNETVSNLDVMVSLVNFHGQGFLIGRTPAAAIASQMKSAVPNVIQEARY